MLLANPSPPSRPKGDLEHVAAVRAELRYFWGCISRVTGHLGAYTVAPTAIVAGAAFRMSLANPAACLYLPITVSRS